MSRPTFRWQRTARYVYDVARIGAQQLRHDRAPQMAAALAYRSLFALFPVLIVTMITVRSAKGTDAFLRLIHDIFASVGLDKVRVTLPSAPHAEPSTSSMSLAAWLEELTRQAADVNLAAAGWIGVVVIGYAAIGLMVTIENGFNHICRAPEGRPWSRRIPLYWFVLTVSPVALGIGWYLNSMVIARIEGGWQIPLLAVGTIWNLLVGSLVLFGVYKLVPNTTVAVRPALAGAFVSALLLEIGKRFFDLYLGKAFSVSQLYGSLGLVPLFMFWVYLMWLAVLFGLEVCAMLQGLRGSGKGKALARESPV